MANNSSYNLVNNWNFHNILYGFVSKEYNRIDFNSTWSCWFSSINSLCLALMANNSSYNLVNNWNFHNIVYLKNIIEWQLLLVKAVYKFDFWMYMHKTNMRSHIRSAKHEQIQCCIARTILETLFASLSTNS
jgi:hypothetical protein